MMEAPTERDLARLRENLLGQLGNQALKDMEAMLAPGDQIFADTLKVNEIIDENLDPPLGQPGKNVKLSMQIEFVASYASEKDLTQLASTVLNASLPEGFVSVRSPLDFEPLNAHLTNDQGVTRWSVRVSRQLEKKMDTGRIISLVQGRSLAAASTRLNETLSLPNPPDIYLEPEWWPWLPLIPFNISVEVK